ERFENPWVRLASAEPERRSDAEVVLVPAVWVARGRAPARRPQTGEHPDELRRSVAERGIHLENVQVLAQSTVPQQVPDLLHREEVLPRRQASFVRLRQDGMTLVIQWVDRFLVPQQVVRRQRVGVGQGGAQVE